MTGSTEEPTMVGGAQRFEQGDHALVVRREWCKGCDLCIKSCPAGILSLARDNRIQVEDIAKCIFCGVCAVRCPDFVFVLDRPTPGEDARGAA